MKNRFSLLLILFLCVFLIKDLKGQATLIKMKNGTQYSYPTSIIKKMSFSNNQLVLDLISPTPVIIAIDSIQTIRFNQTLSVQAIPSIERSNIEAIKQLLTLIMPKYEKKSSPLRSILITI